VELYLNSLSTPLPFTAKGSLHGVLNPADDVDDNVMERTAVYVRK
jgi:hypothetical protein